MTRTTYLEEFSSYYDNFKVLPSKPKEKAELLFVFNRIKMFSILQRCGIKDVQINAVLFVSDGNTYLEASREFDTSSQTIRNWINTAYDKVLEEAVRVTNM